MEEIRQAFQRLVEHETTKGVGAAQTMREVWEIVKNRSDPFSMATKSVIVKRSTEIRETSKDILRIHSEIFQDRPVDDQLIDFLAAQQQQVRIAEEILREDLTLPTEP